MILKWLLAVASSILLASCCAAQTANGCALPAGMYQQRKTFGRSDDRRGEIDRKYVEFMKAAVQFYADREAESVSACCDAAKKDPIGVQFCTLVRYLLSDRKDIAAFLAAMPKTDRQLEAFWLMDSISGSGTMEFPALLAGLPAPDGLADACIDELFALIKTGNAAAAERYLCIYDRANGEYGEYIDDQLEKLFREYPQRVVELWPVFRTHLKELEAVPDDIPRDASQRIAAKYENLCESGDNRCAEIRRLFRSR
jgi:hypothetical protein